MPSFNRVTLIGNVTRDPQTKQHPSMTIVEFGLAMNRKFKGADGGDREEVCFVDCAAFDKRGETIAQYVQKGDPLFVEGRLKFDTWDDRSGQKRFKLSVVVDNFQFLKGRDDGGGQRQAGGGRSDQGDGMPGYTDVPPAARQPRQQQGGRPQQGRQQQPPAE